MAEKKKKILPKVKETPVVDDNKVTLPPLADQFGDAWQLYKKTFLAYLKIVGVGILLVVVGIIIGVILAIPLFVSTGGQTQSLFSHPTPQQIAGLIVIVVWFLAYIIVLSLYGLFAPVSYLLVLTSSKKLSLKELYRESKPFIWPLFVTSMLSSVLVLGGVGVFVLPGLVFGIFFGFITNIVVLEKLRGIDALKRSFQLVRANFWGVILRAFIIEAIVYLGSNIFDTIARQSPDLAYFKIISQLFSVAIEWYVVVYMFLLYKQLRNVKGALPSINFTWVIAIIGWVFLFGLIVYVVTNPSLLQSATMV